MFEPKKILVPMDFSDESMLAWEWARMLARQSPRVALYPTYVVSLIPDLIALDVGRAGYQQATQDWIQAKMITLQSDLEPLLFLPTYATGQPAEEIVQICREKGIELVIMTTHGRTGVSHLLHKNVAETIVRTAPCPVLVLHLNGLTVAASKS